MKKDLTGFEPIKHPVQRVMSEAVKKYIHQQARIILTEKIRRNDADR